ncbi:MAG: DNA repair protein RecN [Bacteroidaceae bacterium]|nr:DNA repair protein RecN [Bacteroidaceae bacterium]
MLTHLHIENYALIEQLDLELHDGFSVITGETGAGKSILLGAIGLILGNRADSKSIKTGAARCVVEATFNLNGYDCTDFFTENDLEYDASECIIRRELTSTGKSRAFINDTPVQLTLLKTLGDRLIDIHSQHQNLLLSQANFQLSVLDTIAENAPLLQQYQTEYSAYRQLCDDYDQAVNQAQQSHDDEEYLRFQLQQLTDAKLQDGEQADLEAEQEILEHAEEIKQALYSAGEALQTTTDGNDALSLMRSAMQSLEHITSVLPVADELLQRLQSCNIELQDIADEIASQSDSVEYNPERLSFVSERLGTIYSLQKKHHLSSVAELLELQANLEQKLNLITNSEELLAELQKKRDAKRAEAAAIADKLHKKRTDAAKTLQKQISTILQSLGMPNVQFQVDMQTGELNSAGFDTAIFLFSANKNVPPQPLSKIASGGEIARLMLSLKFILASKQNLPTIIFDEIDTGVSGIIAEKMAHIMSDMASYGRQVISITHLPQIAAIGQHHFKVYKDDTTDSTLSHIIPLTADQRIEEIAHMLSGANLTEAALQNAKALLG